MSVKVCYLGRLVFPSWEETYRIMKILESMLCYLLKNSVPPDGGEALAQPTARKFEGDPW